MLFTICKKWSLANIGLFSQFQTVSNGCLSYIAPNYRAATVRIRESKFLFTKRDLIFYIFITDTCLAFFLVSISRSSKSNFRYLPLNRAKKYFSYYRLRCGNASMIMWTIMISFYNFLLSHFVFLNFYYTLLNSKQCS